VSRAAGACSIGLVLLMTALGGDARAARKAKRCREACRDRTTACQVAAAEFGTLAERCAKTVLKRCVREGLVVCTALTTTTTVGTTTTTTTLAAPVAGALLDTGQTACWDTAGAPIPCAGTGQDGELRKGLARAYADNGDGTITDTTTGLVWEKLSDDGSIHDKDDLYAWTAAVTVKVAALNATGFASHTDWRLPNANELQSLIHYGAGGPAVSSEFDHGCAPGCTVLTCSCMHFGRAWSSSTFAGAPERAWVVYFNTFEARAAGSLSVGHKTEEMGFVRAVRGGS
jgi:Protein of unknown function (DUF1566)